MLAALVAVVVGHVGDGRWTDAPTEARSDEHAELAVVIEPLANQAPATVDVLRWKAR